MNTIPLHGKLPCALCFTSKNQPWGEGISENDGWRLENNPCSWGASNPSILILGFSKGNNQTNNILKSNFNDIPFKGMRNNLTNILRKLNLLKDNEIIDEKICESESEFSFGSLIRCSISKKDLSTQKFIKSGDIIKSAATDKTGMLIINNCVKQFLKNLPPKLKIVIMLSNDDNYVEACMNTFKIVHPDIKKINDVAYANNQVTFIHVIHPSGASGKHIPDWLNGTTGKQAYKRELAINAIKSSNINLSNI